MPKDESKRERRNPPTFESVELDGAKVGPPELPDADELREATRRWWATWCASPQAEQFIGTDWERLLMLAPLVDRFYREKEPRLLAEIRANEAELGATPYTRLRLRWRMREAAREEERAEKSSRRQVSRRKDDPRLKLVKGAGS